MPACVGGYGARDTEEALRPAIMSLELRAVTCADAACSHWAEDSKGPFEWSRDAGPILYWYIPVLYVARYCNLNRLTVRIHCDST